METQTVGEIDNRPQFENVIFKDEVLDEMTTYMRSTNIESGGILVGQFCEDDKKQKFTQVVGFIPNKEGASSWGSIKFTDEAWADMLRALDQTNAGKSDQLSVVGWVHSHPSGSAVAPQSQGDEGYGDRFIIKNYFPKTKFITMIYGNGGVYDNQYAIWRSTENKTIRQKGFEIETKDQTTKVQYYDKISEIDL